MQDKVSTLNIELKNLNLLILSKETEVQKLFEQTEAGQEENERKRQEHIQSIKDRIDPLLKRTISDRGVSQDRYHGYYNIFQLNDYNPRFISSLRERLEIMKPALTDLTDYIILEPAEGAFKEDYFEVLTEFLYDKFMDNHDGYGFNEQTIDKIKESKFDVDIKQEIRSSLELYNFKAKNEGKLEKAVNTSKFNEHLIKNEELISKSKDCLEDSLEVVVSKAKTYFSEIKNLLADKGMLPDEDVVEKYRNLLPKNIQELNFKIGGNHSTQMYIEFPIKKDVQKLTLYAQGVLEKNIEKNEKLLQEKRGKLFSSGMKKLENEITRLHDELKSLHSKNRDLYFELDKEITAFRELKIEVNGSEEMLLYSINKLINSFHDKFNYNFDSDVIFGKNSYPRIDQILTIDKIYDKLNYIPLSQESNQLMEQEKEMKAKLQRDSEVVDSKLAEVFNK